MDYIAVTINTAFEAGFVADLLTAALADIGFESFETGDCRIKAYCPHSLFSREEFDQTMAGFPYPGATVAAIETIADQDWNASWEEDGFRPVVVGDCVVHGPRHTDFPAAHHEVVIDPQMSFGSGSHATTSLMMQILMSKPVSGLRVLDMGCGTGVLALLARKLGAASVTAVDIDPRCVENTLHNARLNHIDTLEVLCGSTEQVRGRQFDLILANINRNILIDNMAAFAALLPAGGRIAMSGFFPDDIPLLHSAATAAGFSPVARAEHEGWAAIELITNHSL